MIFASQSAVLVVFFRKPSLGTGKRRLAATLGEQAALEASELLLSAALEDAAAWPGQLVLSPERAADASWARSLLPYADVIPQCDGNLGERIEAVFAKIRRNGGQKIIAIGSDSPALSNADLARAAEALDDHDVVLMPALDGGVTLMGARCMWPDLADLPWGTDRLGSALLDACTTQALSSCVMPTGHDIDTEQDLLIAARLLDNDPRPVRRKLVDWVLKQLDSVEQDIELSVSVIVPVYSDDEALSSLLAMLSELSPAAAEVIVVDGEHSPECARLTESHDAVYITCEANRGAQLCKGARFSRGDALWFLHADARPPANAIAIIRSHLASGFDSGYFSFRFDTRSNWGIRLLQSAINLRARIGVPYGDQGLFVRSSTYFAGGGHSSSPLFEEVKLVRFLRSHGRFLPVDASIGVSARRWERDGWVRRTVHNRFLALAHALGVSPDRLARRYHVSKNKS